MLHPCSQLRRRGITIFDRVQYSLHFNAHCAPENGFLRICLIFFGNHGYCGTMDFEFSSTQNPVAAPDFAVRTIYHVKGDPSYDVRAAGNIREGYIALRTLDGEGTVEFSRTTPVNLQANSLLFFPYERLSRYRCSGLKWEFWWFHFDTSAEMPSVLAAKHVAEARGERVLCHEAVEKLSSRDRLSRAGASIILARLYSLWLGSLISEGHAGAKPTDKIEPAMVYLHGNYSRTIRIGDLAAMCNMSTRRFQDLFINHTGLTPTAYLANVRSTAVKTYLTNTNLTMKEIAERTGFCNEYYLSRCFRRQTGAPPGEFRKERTWASAEPSPNLPL